MGSIVGRGLVFGFAEGKVSTEVFEGVVFDGYDAGDCIVWRLLRREQLFHDGMVV